MNCEPHNSLDVNCKRGFKMKILSYLEELEIAVTTASSTATVQVPGLPPIIAQALFLVAGGGPILINTVFTVTSINYEGCDISENEVLDVKGVCQNTTIFPSTVKLGDTFILDQLTLNTFCLSRPVIKLDFACNIVSDNLGGTISFQIFKNRYGQSVPIGPIVLFSEPRSITSILNYFVFDEVSLNNENYTYELVATIL